MTTFVDFLDRFQDSMAQAVVENYPPQYGPKDREKYDLSQLKRRPMGAQSDAIRAVAKSLRTHAGTNVVGEMGTGKAQPLDSLVLTPVGWRQMGDLKVGDEVIGRSGQPCRIVGVFPQGEQEVFRVTFSDGASVECTDDHLWSVNTPNRRWHSRPDKVLPLREIRQRLVDINGNSLHFVPMVEPVEGFRQFRLLINPYTLGALLGDGCMSSETNVSLSSGDIEIVNEIEDVLPDGMELNRSKGSRYNWRISTPRRNGRVTSNPVIGALRELGLMGCKSEDKFIPRVYLQSSLYVRVELLRGLMDTDGYVNPKNGTGMEFVTVSPQLARDFQELVESLGGTCPIRTKRASYVYRGERREGQPAYRLTPRLPNEIVPFHLSRKANACRLRRKYLPVRAIVSAEPVGVKPCQCIAVDAPDQLYVTDHYIVTHNTMISVSAAYLSGMKRAVVVCPPHLVHKWKREIEIAIPNVHVVIATSLSDLQQVHQRPDDGKMVWVVVSRERSKLSYQWEPATVTLPWSKWTTKEVGYRKVKKYKKGVHVETLKRNERGDTQREQGPIIQVLCCPHCHEMIVNERTGAPIEEDELRKKRMKCRKCHGALWTASRTGPRRYPLADWIGKKMRGWFDLAILDECHEGKARASAQGIAYATIASSAKRILTLTGTIFGGYSSTLFYLLYRFSPEFRGEFNWKDEQRWIDLYGIREVVTKRSKDNDNEARYYGRSSKRKEYETTRERPGLSPAALFHLIGNTVFISLPDVASNLPPYTEIVRMIPMDGEQGAAYQSFQKGLYDALVEALVSGSKRLLGAYLQALLGYPERCYESMEVYDPLTGKLVASAPGLGHKQLYPKEEELIELVREERKLGRRVWVYITHTHKGETPLGKRLKEKLGQAGIRVAVLDSAKVPPDKREAWIQKQVDEGVDVIVSHPKSVATGLDLIAFPTMVYYQTEYSVYTMRQSSRRSWRIGQDRDVKIVFFVYEGTLQAEALSLVAAKMKASLMVEGNLADEGLAALNDDSGDIFVQLAKRLDSATKSDAATLERMFADTRRTEKATLDVLARNWTAEATPAVARTEVVELDLVTDPAPPAVIRQVDFAEFVRLHPAAVVVPKRKSAKSDPPPGQLGFSW